MEAKEKDAGSVQFGDKIYFISTGNDSIPRILEAKFEGYDGPSIVVVRALRESYAELSDISQTEEELRPRLIEVVETKIQDLRSLLIKLNEYLDEQKREMFDKGVKASREAEYQRIRRQSGRTEEP